MTATESAPSGATASLPPATAPPDTTPPATTSPATTPPVTLQSVTAQEIATQPGVWRRAIAVAEGAAWMLPQAGDPVLFLGCGTSYYMGEAYARLRTAAGLGPTRAVIPSELDEVRDDETIVVLSRSGTTGDVIARIRELRGTHHVIGLVGEAETPVDELCDDVVLLDFADERSVVQTRFATSALTVLRACLGEDVAHLPGEAARALDLPLPDPLPEHVVFLGHGWTVGLAQEAALKCREAAGAWTEAYPVFEYQHGPIAVAGPRSVVWSFTPLPEHVRAPIEATGAHVVHHADLDPQASLVVAHRLAVALAARAGRDPDRPRHLSRSVLAV